MEDNVIDCIQCVEEPSSKDENTTVKNSAATIGLSPVNERKTAMQSSLRKVLSSNNSNIITEPLKGTIIQEPMFIII